MASEKKLAQRYFDFFRSLQSAEKQIGSINKNQALEQDLMQQYRVALHTYLSKCKPYICPAVLEYPFLFFYRGAKNDIYTIDYLYGSQRKSKRLTEDDFPYLLQAIFSPFVMQYFPTRGKEAEDLYSNLQNLILNYPYDRLALILEELRKYAPPIAFEFSKPSAFRYSSEGNLYLNHNHPDKETRIYFYNSILEYDFLTKRKSEGNQHIPTRILKSFFYELLNAFRASPGNVPQIVYTEPSHEKTALKVPTLYFQSSFQKGLDSVCYSPNTDCFRSVTLPDIFSSTGYYPKTIRSPNRSGGGLPTAIHSFMTSLVGENLSLLEQFLLSLTEAMLTDGPRFLVLHTRAHKKELQSFFSDTLSPTAVKIDFQPHPKARQRTCLTLTQLAKPTHLRSLFLAQSAGKCTVLVDDVLPSDASLRTLRKLISGKRIAINSDFAPPQHYNNRLCIVCVTDDHEKAEYFQKKLKAKLIDFSLSESAALHDLKFEPQDAAWIYNTLIPYGLKLKTLQTLDIADPAPFDFPHTPTPPSEEACVRSFLDLCYYEKGCLCTTSEVYDSYCQFLAVTHSGRTPSLTKTVFNKKFKEFTRSKFVFKRPHRSRTGPSPYCYVGLKLPEVFPPPVTPDCVSQESLLQQYLEHISKYQIKHDGLRVKVIQAAKE